MPAPQSKSNAGSPDRESKQKKGIASWLKEERVRFNPKDGADRASVSPDGERDDQTVNTELALGGVGGATSPETQFKHERDPIKMSQFHRDSDKVD